MDGVTGPELIQGGRPDERSPVAPSAVWRVAAAAAIVAVAVGVLWSRGPSTTGHARIDQPRARVCPLREKLPAGRY